MQILLIMTFLFAITVSAKTGEHTMPIADLTRQQPSWVAVGAGTAVAPPVETDFGFVVFTDGRMISAFSRTGTRLWQKAVNGKQTPYLTAFGDFLYVITAGRTLNLVNPSGLTLWSVNVGFVVTESPLVGRDGRVFVRGKNALACYGLSGIRKWSIVTGEADTIPLLTFDDGSLLAVSRQTKDGASTGIRVSPFGEVLETLTFTGRIIAASTCDAGILISQDDKAIALCNVRDDKAVKAWVINSAARGNAAHICVTHDGTAAAFFSAGGKGTTFSLVSIATGTLLEQAELGDIQLKNLSFLRATTAGFLLADEKHALECKPDGSLIWQAELPKKSTWDFVFYTTRNDLVLCQKDWSLRAFLMRQTVERQMPQSAHVDHPSYLTIGTAKSTIGNLNIERLSAQTLAQMSAGLKRGDYGKSERTWLSNLKSEMQSYFMDEASVMRGRRDGGSYFKEHPIYTQSLIQLMAQFGSDCFADEFVTLLTREKDPSLLALTIREAGRQGYDGEGKILAALESVAEHRLSPRDQNALKILCDATFSICRFMGRPALVTKGKAILTYLFLPQFDTATRDYARKTLARLKDLGL